MSSRKRGSRGASPTASSEGTLSLWHPEDSAAQDPKTKTSRPRLIKCAGEQDLLAETCALRPRETVDVIHCTRPELDHERHLGLISKLLKCSNAKARSPNVYKRTFSGPGEPVPEGKARVYLLSDSETNKNNEFRRETFDVSLTRARGSNHGQLGWKPKFFRC